MFKLKRDTNGDTDIVTASFNLPNRVADYAEEKVMKRLVEALVSEWVSKYGAETIDTLTPGTMAKEIETAIKQRFAESLVQK